MSRNGTAFMYLRSYFSFCRFKWEQNIKTRQTHSFSLLWSTSNGFQFTIKIQLHFYPRKKWIRLFDFLFVFFDFQKYLRTWFYNHRPREKEWMKINQFNLQRTWNVTLLTEMHFQRNTRQCGMNFVCAEQATQRKAGSGFG